MNKECNRLSIVWLALAVIFSLATSKVYSAYSTSKSNYEVLDTTSSFIDNLNFKTFEIYSEQECKYFAEFWLLPSKHSDGYFTTFFIYLNGDAVGTITPSEGNWQSIHIDGNQKLTLSKGKNIIAIGTYAPEIPSVETLKMAINESDAKISSEAYKSFIDKASCNTSFNDCIFQGDAEDLINETGTSTFIKNNIPLVYTFYTLIEFTKGQDVFLSSSSSEEHNLDLLYYGQKLKYELNPQDDLTKNDQAKELPFNSSKKVDSITGNTILLPDLNKYPDPVYLKAKDMYYLASSEEMQGLNWKGPSIKSNNSSIQIATIHEKIPKSGVYLVRLRHKNNGSMGMADLNINGTYYYENIPMTFSYVDCIIPSDNLCYESFTLSKNPKADPILFVHGADADRIVGFNDDSPSEIGSFFGLSTFDSYIAQQYKFKTSGLSVSNYSSSDPESTCTITSRSPQTIPITQKTKNNNSSCGVNLFANHYSPNTEVQVFISVLNKTIIVLSSDEISQISVYDLSGHEIWSSTQEGLESYVPISSLNIPVPGMYIICVETGNQIMSKKVMIK